MVEGFFFWFACWGGGGALAKTPCSFALFSVEALKLTKKKKKYKKVSNPKKKIPTFLYTPLI